jgi:hypothetical protein
LKDLDLDSGEEDQVEVPGCLGTKEDRTGVGEDPGTLPIFRKKRAINMVNMAINMVNMAINMVNMAINSLFCGVSSP